tara:strand:+ start:201 stop:572 length:372 start_codon:yes stop_codon:yes gene_type:complete
MTDYTQSFYLEKDKDTGKEVLGLDFSYLIALIILAACGFLIALQLNGLFQSINDSLVQFLKKYVKNIVVWSWLLTLIITIIVMALSIGLIWVTFKLLIKNNERAKKQIITHHPENLEYQTKRK